jgi:hypothetical protein
MCHVPLYGRILCSMHPKVVLVLVSQYPSVIFTRSDRA